MVRRIRRCGLGGRGWFLVAWRFVRGVAGRFLLSRCWSLVRGVGVCIGAGIWGMMIVIGRCGLALSMSVVIGRLRGVGIVVWCRRIERTGGEVWLDRVRARWLLL